MHTNNVQIFLNIMRWNPSISLQNMEKSVRINIKTSEKAATGKFVYGKDGL